MKKSSLTDRLRYLVDNMMSRGPAVLIVWLASITILLVVAASFFIQFVGSDPDKDLGQVLYTILFQALTPTTVSATAGSSLFLGTMLGAGVGGVLFVSVFIGILTNLIDSRLQDLRKGRSTVLESDHTLILGWSAQIITIISQLVITNAEHNHPCIVILADRDKVQMEDEIRAKVRRTGRTRIVCRTGNPLDPTDLEIVSPDTARSIIVLAPENDDPDTYVIKTLLALTNNPAANSRHYHIVADIQHRKNLDVARMVGGDEVELVLVTELISRIMVQTCRQTGLSIVYTELLNFEGDELYFKQEPALVNRTFGEALLAFEDSVPVGLQRREDGTCLNPPMDTPIGPGDQIIAISENNASIRLSGLTDVKVDEETIQKGEPSQPKAEGTLILGWNRHARYIISELDQYVAPGSHCLVVAHLDGAEAQIAPYCAGLKNSGVSFRPADTTNRAVLDELAVPCFQHVIVLSYSDILGIQEADARTLMTLLHLRDIRERSGADFSIVSEMLDVRNRDLADVTRADDFIVSDQIVSFVLTQVSENRHLNAVFSDLFDPGGSEVYLKPAQEYVRLGEPVNFYTVTESARRRGQVALGYRLAGGAREDRKTYGIVVNPNKLDRLTYGEGDKIIVLAER